MNWTYAIQGVVERAHTLLLSTVDNLKDAGFDTPYIFVDGANHPTCTTLEAKLGLPVTGRLPKANAYNNWALILWELWCRNPEADRFAIFQDDVIVYKNLREYLEWSEFPDKGYWNLYTFPSNQQLCPVGHEGWYASNQLGRGAVGLIFSRAGVQALLKSDRFVNHPAEAYMRERKIDGVVCEALNPQGFLELVHNPSLAQHIGNETTVDNLPHPKAVTFRGTEFDARELIDHVKPTAIQFVPPREYRMTRLEANQYGQHIGSATPLVKPHQEVQIEGPTTPMTRPAQIIGRPLRRPGRGSQTS
jgi:hypothetical protein